MFCAEVVDEILSQIKQFRRNGPVSDFARKIKHLGRSRVLIPEEVLDGKQIYSIRSPDASFGHLKAHYPGMVIEVCHSKKSARVPHLADEYILNTDGNMKAVVAFNIYKGSKAATFTVWRPEYVVEDGVQVLQAAAAIKSQVRLLPGQY